MLTPRALYRELDSFQQRRPQRPASALPQGSLLNSRQVYREFNRQAGMARSHARRLHREQEQALTQAAEEAAQSEQARQEASRRRREEALRREQEAQASQEIEKRQEKIEDLEFAATASQGKASKLRRKLEDETARLGRREENHRIWSDRVKFIMTPCNTPPNHPVEYDELTIKIERVEADIVDLKRIISTLQEDLKKTQEESLRYQLETKAAQAKLTQLKGGPQEPPAAPVGRPEDANAANGNNQTL